MDRVLKAHAKWVLFSRVGGGGLDIGGVTSAHTSAIVEIDPDLVLVYFNNFACC